jgi:hypothetical protein
MRTVFVDELFFLFEASSAASWAAAATEFSVLVMNLLQLSFCSTFKWVFLILHVSTLLPNDLKLPLKFGLFSKLIVLS